MDAVIWEYTPQDESRLLEILKINNKYFETIDPWKVLRLPKNAEQYYLQQMIQGTNANSKW